MTTTQLYKRLLIVIIILNLCVSCANYSLQTKENNQFDYTFNTIDKQLSHRFYLLGDGGKSEIGQELVVFNALNKELSGKDNSNTSVLFLGDNIYPKGMPSKKSDSRELAQYNIDIQLNSLDNYNGNTYIIPGNHDWYSDGIKGLKREQKYIDKKMGKNVFYPKNGCPLKKININESTVLIIVDSQWYLENWDDNPGINDNCDIKTRAKFFEEFAGLISKNANKNTIVAIHHPMYTYGSHGGQFSLRSQIFPFSSSIPLPIIGSIISLLRKTGGVSTQDLQNYKYRKLKNRLITLSRKSENVVFVSGHEHSLQYIEEDGIKQVISGSASKKSATRLGKGALFTYGALGYAVLDITKTGKTIISYFKVDSNSVSTKIFSHLINDNKKLSDTNKVYKTTSNKTKASIYSKDKTDKSKLYKLLMGNHYRDIYSKPIEAEKVNLDTLYGGLTVIRKGGGNQSVSLRLKANDGREFVMRKLKKSAVLFLQSVAFKDKYIAPEYNNTLGEDVLMDFYTSAHPYIPFSIGYMADAIDIYHTNPKLYYIESQKALKQYNQEFGGHLYMIEERPSAGHKDLYSFGYTDKIISTDDLRAKLRKNKKHSLDEETYIRARLFDMILGDWDRHQDQWRWGVFKQENGNTIYKPIPRDRDQAFSNYDGYILELVTRILPDLRLMQTYSGNIRDIKWFNSQALSLDKSFTTRSSWTVWQEQIDYIQAKLSDKVIMESFEEMPKELDISIAIDLKNKLRQRIENLSNIAREYYDIITNYSVVKATDKDDYILLEPKENGNLSIKIYNKDNIKDSPYYSREFNKKETKEIWLYGLDGKDVFESIKGIKNNIKVRIIGGMNKDTYILDDNNYIVYDHKTKKNNLEENNSKVKLTDSYDTNIYNYRKTYKTISMFTPLLGSNPDDGFKLGFNKTYTINSFKLNPFTRQHKLSAMYYYATQGYELNYSLEFGNVFDKVNIRLATNFTSPNYSINYFGDGNETNNIDYEKGDNYNRVRIRNISFVPSLVFRNIQGSALSFSLVFENKELHEIKGRFLNETYGIINHETYEDETYGAIEVDYIYSNKDNKLFPTLGMEFGINLGVKKNISEVNNPFYYIKPNISFIYRLTSSANIVLATKFNSELIYNDYGHFYNATTIGGDNGVRAYRNQRFTGDKSFYQNTDLRIRLFRKKTYLFPVELGLFGSFDYGKVWIDNQDSQVWHKSTGGGLWLNGADLFNFNTGLYHGSEGYRFVFGLGFGF